MYTQTHKHKCIYTYLPSRVSAIIVKFTSGPILFPERVTANKYNGDV